MIEASRVDDSLSMVSAGKQAPVALIADHNLEERRSLGPTIAHWSSRDITRIPVKPYGEDLMRIGFLLELHGSMVIFFSKVESSTTNLLKRQREEGARMEEKIIVFFFLVSSRLGGQFLLLLLRPKAAL